MAEYIFGEADKYIYSSRKDVKSSRFTISFSSCTGKSCSGHKEVSKIALLLYLQVLGSTVQQQQGGWGGMGVHPMMNAQDGKVWPGLGRG